MLAALVWGAADSDARLAACAPGYSPCLPVVADLDCAGIPEQWRPVRVTGADPYKLDRDGDGLACEVAGAGGGKRSPWGLILQKPAAKEAKSVRVGDTLRVYGWSPASYKNEQFQLCVIRRSRFRCLASSTYVLKGTVQVFGAWKVARGESDPRGRIWLALKVRNQIRVSDTVRLA